MGKLNRKRKSPESWLVDLDFFSAAKLEKIDNDKNGPIFENKIKLKKERTKEKKHLVDSVVDNAVETTLKKESDSKKIEKSGKSGKSGKKSKSKSPENEQNDKENLKVETAEKKSDEEKTIKSTKKGTKKKDEKTKTKPKKEPKKEIKVETEPSDDRAKESDF